MNQNLNTNFCDNCIVYLISCCAENALIETRPLIDVDILDITGARDIPSILLISLADLRYQKIFYILIEIIAFLFWPKKHV